MIATARCVDVDEFLRCIHADGSIYEIRSVHCPERVGGTFTSTMAGWFNDAGAAAEAIAEVDGLKPPAIYVTLNPVNPNLLGRGNNRMVHKCRSTTSDEDIIRRRWLFIDIDAKRPAGISSTDAELAEAVTVSDSIVKAMRDDGWPEPLVGMSGNGRYLLWGIDLPNDEASKELIKSVLQSLAAQYDSDGAEVDCSTFNAGRIAKVLGTVARKGDELLGVDGVDDRPHRRSWFIPPTEPLQIVTAEQLRVVAGESPEQSPSTRLARVQASTAQPDVIDRASRYLAKCEPAVAGQKGHSKLLTAAVAMVQGFALSDGDAMRLLAQEYNPRCEPAWSDWELRHKVDEAGKLPGERGRLLNARKASSKQTAGPEQLNDPASDPVTIPAGRLLTQYVQQIRAGDLPQLISQPGVLDGIEVGAGLITIIGAPPGFGKTALAMQVMFDALELDDTLRAVVANAETSFDGLLRRELTRITRIDSKSIRFGQLTPQDLEQITAAASELIPRLQRVAVLNDPCNVIQLYKLRDEPPGLLIVDYLQKFAPSDKDGRQGANEVVAALRALAKLGWAVLCLSATKRDSKGQHNSKELGLSSYRDSGEIEYNADSAYVMVDNGPMAAEYIRHITLSHCKNRHGQKVDHQLCFHMPRMSFGAMPAHEFEGSPEFGNVVGVDDPFAEVS